MDIEKELERVKQQQSQLVNEVNQIETQKQALVKRTQDLLQEALRLDGEIRLLLKMKEEV